MSRSIIIGGNPRATAKTKKSILKVFRKMENKNTQKVTPQQLKRFKISLYGILIFLRVVATFNHISLGRESGI